MVIPMKRDMNLIREILLEIETKQKGSDRIELQAHTDYSSDELNYHLGLLLQADYIDADADTTYDGTSYTIRGLTWYGHDFLDSVRSEPVWSSVNKKLSKVGGTAAIELIKYLAVEAAKVIMSGK